MEPALGYDTIYAHQDKEDDILIGVKSTALKFGEATKLWLWAFHGGSIALLALAGALTGLSWPFFVILAGVAAHFAWGWWTSTSTTRRTTSPSSGPTGR